MVLCTLPVRTSSSDFGAKTCAKEARHPKGARHRVDSCWIADLARVSNVHATRRKAPRKKPSKSSLSSPKETYVNPTYTHTHTHLLLLLYLSCFLYHAHHGSLLCFQILDAVVPFAARQVRRNGGGALARAVVDGVWLALGDPSCSGSGSICPKANASPFQILTLFSLFVLFKQ